MDVGVKTQRQVKDMIEILRHDGEATAVRKAVRLEADRHGGADREQAKARPGQDQRQEVAPGERRAGGL